MIGARPCSPRPPRHWSGPRRSVWFRAPPGSRAALARPDGVSAVVAPDRGEVPAARGGGGLRRRQHRARRAAGPSDPQDGCGRSESGRSVSLRPSP